MHMAVMTGTRITSTRHNRTAIGKRGWWMMSSTRSRGISQSLLARRYSPSESIGVGGLLALMAVGAFIGGSAGAITALIMAAI